jgi:hypothetical protein
MKICGDSKFGIKLIRILGTAREHLGTFILFAIEMGKRSHKFCSGILGMSGKAPTSLVVPVTSSVCLSACISVAPTSGISEKLHVGDFSKISGDTPIFG